MRSTASRTDPFARLTFLLAAGFAALLASAPAVTLWEETAHALVPWVSSDQYLYLNISHVRPDAQGLVRNPYYGGTIPASDVPYLRFGLALRLFDLVRSVSGGDAQALVAWHAGIAIVIAAALFWLLSAVVKDKGDRVIVLAAFAAIMWIDARYAYADLRRLAAPTSGWIYGLPWARLFYPQVGVAPLLFALGCLLRWMPDRRHALLIGIVAVQLIVFMAFPYAAIIIAGSLVTIAAAALLLRAIDAREAAVLVIVAIVSLSLDAAAFVLTGRGSASVGLPGHGNPLTFDLSQLHVNRTIILPLLFGAIALMLPSVERHVRAVLGGFGIAMGLMRFADVFVSPTLQVGHHIEYFYNLAFWLPLVAIALEIAARVPAGVVRLGAGLATAAMLAFAILDVRATTAAWRPYNRANGELARAFGMLDLTTDDVVVMPIHGFKNPRAPAYWEASWVPLVRPSTVLYTPAGKMLLPRGSTESEARLAAYLYLEGEDVRSLRAMFADPAETNEQHFLAGYGREFLLGTGARTAALAEIGRELEPPLQAIEAGTIPPFLRSARRLIIADYKDDPIFKADRIDRLFTIDRLVRTGAWRITIVTPR